MPHDREKFAPREVTPAEEITLRAHVGRVEALAAKNLLPGDWRDDIAFRLDDCAHTSRTLVEVENVHGVWGVEICNDCGEQVAKECAHVRCDWFLEGALLRCGNCGADCT